MISPGPHYCVAGCKLPIWDARSHGEQWAEMTVCTLVTLSQPLIGQCYLCSGFWLAIQTTCRLVPSLPTAYTYVNVPKYRIRSSKRHLFCQKTLPVILTVTLKVTILLINLVPEWLRCWPAGHSPCSLMVTGPLSWLRSHLTHLHWDKNMPLRSNNQSISLVSPN